MGKAIIEQRARVAPQGAAGGAVENSHDQTDSTAIYLADETTPGLKGKTSLAAERSFIGAQQSVMVDHRHHAPVTVQALTLLDPQGGIARSHDVGEHRMIHRLPEN